MKTLIINPGSTSTKLAIYDDLTPVWMAGAHHHARELAAFHSCLEQYQYRMEFIRKQLRDGGVDMHFDAIMGRGGLLKPMEGGVYNVNEKMKDELLHNDSDHVCNLGALLADELARECGCKAYIADPGVVDELQEVARYTGIPSMRRRSLFHALNSKAVSRKYAASLGKTYEDMRIIVAHLGGGISVSAHCHGRVIDVNNALDGEGPISPERSGTVPSGALVRLCFSGKYTEEQIRKMLHGKGGLMAYLGTNDMIAISRWAEDGEEPARTVLDAMLYTVAKQIGAMYVTLEGRVDAIILTGGIAFSKFCTDNLTRRTDYLAPIVIMPGENEIESLAYNAYCLLHGMITAKEY